MSLDGSTPRVTLGIATYNRDAYLGAAIQSGLDQDYDDSEVLVVVDGSTNPKIDEVLSGFEGEPRLRVVRHERNLGIAGAYNTFVSAGRGELIAMVGDDDLCLPGRLRREVEIFDRFPEVSVVHGDAWIIDERGRKLGGWMSGQHTGLDLVRCFFRHGNLIIDPTRMVHRRVHEKVGEYDGRYPLANDFEFWMRAARHFRFHHLSGDPLTAVRRHFENASGERHKPQEVADVEALLEEALQLYDLRELVPEFDWGIFDGPDLEQQARLRLAELLERREVKVPRLVAKLRGSSRAKPQRRAPSGTNGRRIVMTSFGFNDSGGGTTVPRLVSKELARRGWDVTVFHAAVNRTRTRIPYELVEWEEAGVRLIGVHNRPHQILDLGHPGRELLDPPISTAFATVLDHVKPDVVHFHNLHNLGASLIDHVAARGIPSFFSTHNYWLICPRMYLFDGGGVICDGPGDGGKCAACVESHDVEGHRRRLEEIRARATRGFTAVLAVSEAVRRTLLAMGYPEDLVDLVRQAMPHEEEIWRRVGRDRAVGRQGPQLTVGFIGSAYPHKGPQLLVQAAQQTKADIRVRIIGEIPVLFAAELARLDRRGVADLHGPFSPAEMPELLAGLDAVALPSTWWDCAPLAAAECRAARVPLIVPRLGGVAETVRDGVDGLLFDGLDVGDLARALDRLAAQDGLLERLQGGIEPPRTFASYIDELERYYAGERPGTVARELPPDNLAVRWQGDHGLPRSLSIVNDRITERLSARVLRVSQADLRLDAPLQHIADVDVRHQWPVDLSAPAGGRLAVILPWEFGAVPTEWLAGVQAHVDELWVPSEYVRRMYLDAGLEADRVLCIPNGVDLTLFHPDDGSRGPDGIRFLFVGGWIWRKGPDVLLSAWREAFAGRSDVTLVVKDVGGEDLYRDSDRSELRAYAGSGALPRLELIEHDLDRAELAALYRSCDVLVHPYRGEGFAMPVLEAMASGLPVIVTDGGPTDEFCPLEAGWRIRSRRSSFSDERIGPFTTCGRPWVLEPARDHLVELLHAAAADGEERRRRGRAGRRAAEHLSWDTVAARYDERIAALARQPPLLAGAPDPEPFPLSEHVALRVLATPAWRAEDRLGDLLWQWAAATERRTSACLYLLADPAVDGTPAELEARVLSAAAQSGADLDSGADINLLMEPFRADRDRRLHAAVDVYVPLHAACAGQVRLARAASNEIVSLERGELGGIIEHRTRALHREAA